MALPAWPSCLPLPQLAGYELSLGDAATAIRDTGGPVLARNRHTRQAQAVAAALVLTGLQMAIFEGWHHHLIADGAGWFTMTLAGEGTETNTVRMVGGFRAQLVGDAWRVGLALLVDEPYRGS